MSDKTRLPVLFIPHGGGPWPFMHGTEGQLPDDDPWKELEIFLKGLDASLGRRPKAVLVISAHWEKVERLTVSTAAKPPMLFDYYGFPPHTYQLDYPAPGAPFIAEAAANNKLIFIDLMEDGGLNASNVADFVGVGMTVGEFSSPLLKGPHGKLVPGTGEIQTAVKKLRDSLDVASDQYRDAQGLK